MVYSGLKSASGNIGDTSSHKTASTEQLSGNQSIDYCISKVTLSDPTQEALLETGELNQTQKRENPSKNIMGEYYQLRDELLIITCVVMGIIFPTVWLIYSLKIALNYLLGSVTGVVYLRMLARDVERLGGQNKRLNPIRLVLFIGLIIIATQWNQLEILPIFLGFLTYKVALIVHLLRTVVIPGLKTMIKGQGSYPDSTH